MKASTPIGMSSVGKDRSVARLATESLAALRRGATVRLAAVQYRLDPITGAVALTFDDGPDSRFTPLVLDELAALDVSATFFVVGKEAAKNPQLVRRILAEGHALGTHSASHPYPKQLGLRALECDFRNGKHAVEEIAGAPLSLFRPPHGYLDFTVAAAIRANWFRPWLWTLDSGDWRPGANASDIVAATACASPGDVVLLHDGIQNPSSLEATDRSATVEAVRRIVVQARKRELGFALLPTI